MVGKFSNLDRSVVVWSVALALNQLKMTSRIGETHRSARCIVKTKLQRHLGKMRIAHLQGPPISKLFCIS